MTTIRFPACSLLLAFCLPLVARAPAQTPSDQPEPRQQMPQVLTPIHTAADDEGFAYGIWAAGDDYKASFHGDMTFVPYLGADYPHNQPFAWRTTSVRIGATEILENSAAPVRVQSDYRYEYRFGNVTEAYDVLHEGLEQTFVIHQRPAVGDLVITGAVTTQLTAENVAAAHQELTFRDDQGQAITGYGKAFAFDGHGDRVLVRTAYHDGVITLTVPGGWLARAAMPVTVDPLLGRQWVHAGSDLVGEVDTGRDDEATTANVMMTFTKDVSATDADLWTLLVNDDHTVPHLVYSDITASWDTNEVACAYVAAANRWAVAMRRCFHSSITYCRIRAHSHPSGYLAFVTTVASMATPAQHNDWRIDVSGGDAGVGTTALVVLQREDNTSASGNFSNTNSSAIIGCLLDLSTPNGAFQTGFTIAANSVVDHERPSVNKMAEGGSGSRICVYQAVSNFFTNDDWDIFGKRIGYDGTLASGTWSSDIGALNTIHQLGPVVEGQHGRYAVAFATTDTATTPFATQSIAGKDIQVERFDWSTNSATPSGDKPPVQVTTSPQRIWEATDIGFDTNDRSHWAVAFRSTPPWQSAAYYTRVGFNGAPINQSYLMYGQNGHAVTPVACAFDNDHDTFLFAYGVADNNLNQTYGHRLTYTAPTPPSVYGSACSSATITWSGSQQIGAEFGRIQVSGAPAGSGQFLIVALATANAPVVHPAVFPGCNLLVSASGPTYLGTMPLAIGSNVSWPLALPEWLNPMSFLFQGWHFDGNFFYSTHGLVVPVAK